MKQTDILILLVAAGAAWFLLKSKTSNANTVNNLGTAINGISEIFTGASSGKPGSGWRYFSNGVSIGPDGTYYQNGDVVWKP